MLHERKLNKSSFTPPSSSPIPLQPVTNCLKSYVSRVGNKYYHTWIVENVETESIEFHYNIANTGNWIMIAMGVSLIVCATLFVVNFVKKRKKTTKNEEKTENI